MKDNSKMPAWLQDKKKLIIIGLIILAMIASSANTLVITRFVAGRFINTTGIRQSISKTVSGVFKSNKLDGTYENPYANESLTFFKNGNMVYTFEDELEFGSYKINGDTLILNMGGYEYQFTIEERNKKSLVFNDGYYQYFYERQ